jgi:hypothetical protein
MCIASPAGTLFWDQQLEADLKNDRLTPAAFDSYTVVLFAGIAAEAVRWGDASEITMVVTFTRSFVARSWSTSRALVA